MHRAFEMGNMDFEFVDAGIGGLLAHVGVFALTAGGKLAGLQSLWQE